MRERYGQTGQRLKNVRKTSKSTSGSRKRSRKSPPPGSAAAAVLAAFADVARRRRLRWYLFGAQAVALYGIARTSADVDVTVELRRVSTSAFVEAMEGGGFALRVSDVDGFVAATRVLPFSHSGSGFPIDVVLAGPGLEELFLGRVRELRFEGVRVSVLSPEDLIVTKILAGRPKDIEDVRGILRQRDIAVDPTRARSLLAELEKAIGEGDLVARLDRLLGKVSE